MFQRCRLCRNYVKMVISTENSRYTEYVYNNVHYLILKDFLTFCLVPVLSTDPSRLYMH